MEASTDNDVKTAIISAVSIMNVITNSLVIAVIARNSELREDRTALFMFSLSVSDLATGCTVMPISAAVCSNATPNVKYMTILPDLHMFFLWWFSFNSLHSLCWLTVCKMVAVLKPFRYEQLFTLNRCYGIIVFNWVVGAALAATKFTVRPVFSQIMCVHTFLPGYGISSLSLFTYAVTAVGPILVLLYATTRIFIVIVRTHKIILAQVHAIDGDTGSAGLVTLQAIRSAKNILFICSVSLILTIPLIVFALLRHTGNRLSSSKEFKFAAIWLFSCNSFMNSFLYIVLHRSLRKKTWRLFVDVWQLCHGG